MPNLKVAIIDYQLSNLFSVQHACEYVGLNAKITSDPQELIDADALILPGVGAFADAMKNLRNFKLVSPILKSITLKKPFLGICLGLQLLFERSTEFGNHPGLSVIKGTVVKFPTTNPKGARIRVPQIGWNKIELLKKDNPYLKGIKNNEFMYFVHSYYILPSQESVNVAQTDYEGVKYISAVAKDNVFAVQFHPEKSGPEGLKIYRNFSKLI